jgi:hypothetical protein
MAHIERLLTTEEKRALHIKVVWELEKYRESMAITFTDDELESARKIYCERIEREVSKLPKREAFLISQRYLNCDCDHDYVVFSEKFDPPISSFTFYALKVRAMARLAKALEISFEGQQKLEMNNVL